METTIFNLTQALGWSILHSIWQGALLYIVMASILVSRPKLTAANKYNLAYLMQALLLSGFIATFTYYYEKQLQLVDIETINIKNLVAHFGIEKTDPIRLENTFPYLVALYIIGMLIQALILIKSVLNLKKLKYKGLHGIPSEWNKTFYIAKQQLAIRGRVMLFLSDKISVPLTLGFLKPVVLFPVAYANKMDLKQVEAILLHELAHIKRNDYLFNLIKVAIETILFFNPFVWLLSKIIEQEREHACDDMVLEHVSTPITYAQALVELENLRNVINPALTLAATGSEGDLFKRIKRITKMETKYLNVKQQFLTVLLCSFAIAMIAWIYPVTKAKAKELVEANRIENISTVQNWQTQQDTTKKKSIVKSENGKYTVTQDGKTITYDKDSLPADVKAKIVNLEAKSLELDKMFNSPEWKEKIKNIELQSAEINKQFNSPEWKEHIAKIEKQGQDISKYFESPEWQKSIKEIEEQAAAVSKKFESPEWKAEIKRIEEQAAKIEEKFNSPEWKEKIAKIEADAKEIEKKFNSPEWKAKIKKIEDDAASVSKYFESPEWKEKMKELENLDISLDLNENKSDQGNKNLKDKKGLQKI